MTSRFWVAAYMGQIIIIIDSHFSLVYFILACQILHFKMCQQSDNIYYQHVESY